MTQSNPVAFTDAQAQNESDRQIKAFVDLDLFFLRRNTSSDVRKVTNALAIKRAVKSLILTNTYEKPFHPEISSNIRDMLFENMTPLTSIILSKKVEEVITNFEPRVRLTGVKVSPNLDLNTYEITIEFFINNAPTVLQSIDLFLERIR
jgi:phage baseplate assembly protein W|tara:strand:- start:2234 stop:2680 length:447 start_codon:yes stop_codon:yes gene_type:complete